MPKVYSIDGITPVVHPSAFVHESAVLIGDVIIGARAYIGPCAFVRAEAKIPPRSPAAGIPAKVLRELSADEIKWKLDNAALYQRLTARSAATMKLVAALTEVETDRQRIEIPEAIPCRN